MASTSEIITVTVDIAGMYYGREVEIPVGSTVRDALFAARAKDKTDRAAARAANAAAVPPVPLEPIVPQLNFAEDDRSPEFLRSITVDHEIEVESRQTKKKPVSEKRFYPAGEYTFRSDGVASPVVGNTFVAVDQNGNLTGKGFIQTWQYYVYDAEGIDTSRKASTALTRSVVPFSVVATDRSNTLVDGGQVVFRLVTIFIEPTRRPGIKTAVEPGKEVMPPV